MGRLSRGETDPNAIEVHNELSKIEPTRSTAKARNISKEARTETKNSEGMDQRTPEEEEMHLDSMASGEVAKPSTEEVVQGWVDEFKGRKEQEVAASKAAYETEVSRNSLIEGVRTKWNKLWLKIEGKRGPETKE